MMVRLPGHDLLAGKVGAFYKRKRESGRSGRSAKRVGKTEPTWMVEGKSCSAIGGGTCNASREDSFFLARRKKWNEKGCWLRKWLGWEAV